jgi:23S rRNA (adenine2503-C2)-methyltransferase
VEEAPRGSATDAGEERPALAGLGLGELESLLGAWGAPRYRARQVFRAVQRRGVLDPRAMTTLPASLRERLAAGSRPATGLLEAQTSADGTTKFLFGLADGRRVEAVLIPEDGRATVCVSTQVGCPLRCVFCASGVGGLVRNLEVAEIVEPLLRVRAHLGRRPTHVVAMGMGEPLLNLPALEAAVRLWTDPQGLGFSPRRITVSTAGTPARVDRLAETGLGVNLALSLHAPDDELRARLVPGSPAGRTRALVEAGARYARRTGRDATVEYVLVAGWNDAPAHAEALAALVAGRHLHVNLIPLNPVSHRPDLKAPSGRDALAFARRLQAGGASVTLRTRHGEDIAAACGQLALERALAEGA